MLLGPERGFVLNSTGVAVIEAMTVALTEDELLVLVAGDDADRRADTRAFLEELVRRQLVVRT